jgi:hypothetical protein
VIHLNVKPAFESSKIVCSELKFENTGILNDESSNFLWSEIGKVPTVTLWNPVTLILEVQFEKS